MLAIEHSTIVIVGANDGKYGDPLYEVIRTAPERTRVLLIEPQSELISYLTENYSFHPDYAIHNGAIGPEGVMALYYPDRSVWSYFPDRHDWPAYRVATGIASTDRTHVLRRLERFLPRTVDATSALVEATVASNTLPVVLERVSFPPTIDLLQIDAEGFDDQVVYSSDIEHTRPKIIFFEMHHLSETKQRTLTAYLRDRGYSIWTHRDNSLAIRTTHSSNRSNA